MTARRVQLSGRVIHVQTGPGPVTRSVTSRIWNGLLIALILPPALIAFAFTRFAMSLTAHMLGDSGRRSRPSALRQYLTDFLAHLTAKRISSAGETLITMVRVRDSSGQIFAVRAEGHFRSGSLAPGDYIKVHLRAVNGMHLIAGGHNLTTGEAVRLTL